MDGELAADLPERIMTPVRPGGRWPDGAACRLDRIRAVNAAWNALTYVYGSELPLDVVSLGLVYDVRDEDGVIVVEMTLTAPGSPGAETLPELARAAVAQAVGDVAPVEVHVVWDPPWSPAMIDRIAGEAVGLHVR